MRTQQSFQAVSNMSSPPPRFGARLTVMDTFDEKKIDIDGDGKADLSHGDTVCRIIKSYQPEADIEQVELSDDFQEPLLKNLQHLLHAITSDPVCYAGINLSLSRNTKTHPVQLIQAQQGTLYQQPQSSNRQAIDQAILQTIQAISQQGVPVYIAAGNRDSRYFNGYGVTPHTINVGATDAQGKKAAYSHTSSIVDRFEQGTFSITRVAGGFDITGDGKMDVSNDEVSGGLPLINRFVGKPLNDAVMNERDIALIQRFITEGKPFVQWSEAAKKVFRNKLIHVRDLEKLNDHLILVAGQAALIPPAHVRFLEQMGDYVWLNNPRFCFKADDNRHIVFDPDNSGRKNPVNYISGTSFSAPAALGKDTAPVLDLSA